MPMLQAENVRFQYEYENEASQVVLHGINLTVERGSLIKWCCTALT